MPAISRSTPISAAPMPAAAENYGQAIPDQALLVEPDLTSESSVDVSVTVTLHSVARSATEDRPQPFVAAISNEPAPHLVVDPPIPGSLARGAVLIPYRVDNFHILPVLGATTRSISSPVGHLQIIVDDLPWPLGEFSDSNTIVVLGLRPGHHKVQIELVDPEHRVLTEQTMTFTVPGLVN